MPGHDVIVIGASAGGIDALIEVLRGLPKDLPAALFVVVHTPDSGPGMLPAILSRLKSLPAAHATDGEPIVPGRVYVAPPGHHLLMRRGQLRVTRGPRENGYRPAIDPLFRTAARSYGARVVGVVLSGMLDDGTAGLVAIKDRGGVAVVQEPADAMFPSMPMSAIEYVAVDHVLAAAEIAGTLSRLAHEPVVEIETPPSEQMEFESEIVEFEMDAIESADRPGKPSGFGCPECGGSLWELGEGDLIRFRCRVGHAYSVETYLAGRSQQLEAALWAALNALEEKASLVSRLATRARRQGNGGIAERFERQQREAESRAALVRQVLVDKEGSDAAASGADANFQPHAGGGVLEQTAGG